MCTIPQIDKDITAVHKQLRCLEKINPMSAASWQAAWDKHPDLHAQEKALYRERGKAQLVRDAKETKEATRVARIDSAKFRKESAAKFKAEMTLKAASPALLEALERMLAAYEADKQHRLAFGNDQAADQARAAIASARA